MYTMGMTQNELTTTEAAKHAGVTVATIRTWARYGAITATKTAGAWLIDLDSLRHRIALGRTTVTKQLAVFTDTKTASDKAQELLELHALVPTSRPYRYIAISSQGTDGYLVDTVQGSCTCKGHLYTGKCYHLLAATILETRAARLGLAA